MEIYYYQGLPGHFETHTGFTTPDWMLLHPKEHHNDRYRKIQSRFGVHKSRHDDWDSNDVIELGINPQLSLNYRVGNFKDTASHRVLEMVKDRNQNLIFNSLMDLWGFDYVYDNVQHNIIEDIYEVIELYNLDYNKVAMCTGNARLDEELEKVSSKLGKPKLKNFYFNTYYLRIPLPEERQIDVSKINRKFLFTSRRSTNFRLEMLYNFHKKNMLNEFHWSYNNVESQKVNAKFTQQEIDNLQSWGGWLGEVDRHHLNEVINLVPKTLDRLDGTFSADYQDVLPKQYYETSAFYLIAETHFSSFSEGAIGYPNFLEGWHSEKTQKAFLNKIPAIIFSTANSLKYLKKAGYKTFDTVIDESYDTVFEDDIRFKKCIEEVNRLYHMPYNEIYDAIETLKPVLEHNYKQYIKYSDIEYYKHTVEALFKKP